jgi:hypothetical protein
MEQHHRAPGISRALWLVGGIALGLSGLVLVISIIGLASGSFNTSDLEVAFAAGAIFPMSLLIIGFGSAISRLDSIELHIRESRSSGIQP